MIQVFWEESALNELATLWTNLDKEERKIIKDAADGLEQILKHSADTAGESRSNNTIRVHIIPPLGAMVRVMIQDRQKVVKIIQIWPIYKPMRGFDFCDDMQASTRPLLNDWFQRFAIYLLMLFIGTILVIGLGSLLCHFLTRTIQLVLGIGIGGAVGFVLALAWASVHIKKQHKSNAQ